MARIDWALLCDHAFVDRHEQLSLIGIVRTVSLPCLPCARPQLVLVARLEDIQPAVFQIALRGQRVVSIEIPVVRVNAFSYAGVQ